MAIGWPSRSTVKVSGVPALPVTVRYMALKSPICSPSMAVIDVARLEAGLGGDAVRLDRGDAGGQLVAAAEPDRAGEQQDREDEVRHRAGGDDRRALGHRLVGKLIARSCGLIRATVSGSGMLAPLASPWNLT